MANAGAIHQQGQNPAVPPDHVPLKTWIGVLASMLGAFMAILDPTFRTST
jgi:MFS transporter, DHA2 family, multidrug resistance protein